LTRAEGAPSTRTGGAELTGAELDRASAWVGAHSGLRFGEHNRAMLEDGLLRAAAAEGQTAAQLLERLERMPTEELFQRVLRHVTVGETYLFRHPEHFQLLREQILPTLLVDGRREVRAWSAGCATGEEAWSLAAALVAGCRDGGVSVLGTDLNRDALETARRGLYGSWSVRAGLADSQGLLRALPDGGVEVAPSLRPHVRFAQLNLNDPVYPSASTGTEGLDLILCRNVLVYFLDEAAQKVLARMRDCLRPGGWIVVGALDLDLAPAGLERVSVAGVTLLRRSVEPAQRVARPTPSRPVAAVPSGSGGRARQLLEEARAAADRGALDEAVQLARRSVDEERTPAALHLLGLLVGEQGEEEERLALLREVVARAPDDVLAHLALGMSEAAGSPERRAKHLKQALQLIARRLDGERVTGPEPVSVSWVRGVATAALRRLEGGK